MALRVRQAGAVAWAAGCLIGLAACGGDSPSAPSAVAPPVVANSAPVITAVTASSERAEEGTDVTLTAAVTDAETPADRLEWRWTVPNGAVSGTGATVTWRPAAGAGTPADVEVVVTVVERYSSAGRAEEHLVSRTRSLHYNDSPAETRALALRFLGDFANSTVPPDQAVRYFADSCRGKQAELSDIVNNRATYAITGSKVTVSSVAFNVTLDRATIDAPCEFTSTIKSTGRTEVAIGTCVMTAVYESWRWWLCDSRFNGSTRSGLRFMD